MTAKKAIDMIRTAARILLAGLAVIFLDDPEGWDNARP